MVAGIPSFSCDGLTDPNPRFVSSYFNFRLLRSCSSSKNNSSVLSLTNITYLYLGLLALSFFPFPLTQLSVQSQLSYWSACSWYEEGVGEGTEKGGAGNGIRPRQPPPFFLPADITLFSFLSFLPLSVLLCSNNTQTCWCLHVFIHFEIHFEGLLISAGFWRQ